MHLGPTSRRGARGVGCLRARHEHAYPWPSSRGVARVHRRIPPNSSPPKERLGKNPLWHEETSICWGGIMGFFWSNFWGLPLIFCTHAKKNTTSNLSKFGGQIQSILFFMIFGSRKIGKIIKNSKTLGTPNRLLESSSKIME